MALTLTVRFEATILDGTGLQAETSAFVQVDPTASWSAYEALFNDWLTDLDACTDGQIIGAEAEIIPTLPDGLKTAPTTYSRVSQTGVLLFAATGDTRPWGMPIPALSNGSTVISGGKPVTTVGSPLQVLGALIAGGGSGVLGWTNSTQQAIASLTNALITFRKHVVDLGQNTFERP